MSSPWLSLEQLPALRAIPATWRALLGDDFETFQAAFLQKLPEAAHGVFCERCYCTHEVIAEGEYPPPLIAACRCPDTHCPDIPLTAADIEVWALSWPRLGRALCSALGLQTRPADMNLFNTHQIGLWSADAVPVILTIQAERPDLSTIIAQLSSRLRRPFILLAPTSGNLDAPAQEFLANAGAEFFALEAIVRLTGQGVLAAVKTPGELFAKFAPEPKAAVAEDVARQAFALIQALDSDERTRKAPVSAVFRLYCLENLTPDQIARQLHCARALVYSRLQLLARRLGRNPAELRQYSAQFERIEDSLTDRRARRVHHRSAVYGRDEAEEE